MNIKPLQRIQNKTELRLTSEINYMIKNGTVLNSPILSPSVVKITLMISLFSVLNVVLTNIIDATIYLKHKCRLYYRTLRKTLTWQLKL